jgi:hypothetical protein
MKTKIRQKWILIAGFLIIVLGLIHILSTFFFFRNINQVMLSGIFMFVGTGLSVVLSGSLTIYCSKIIQTSKQISSDVLRIVLLYLYMLSIGAIVVMTDNPFSYIMLIISIFLSIPMLFKENES